MKKLNIKNIKIKRFIPSYFKYFDKQIILKSIILIGLSLVLLTNSFSWMYDEFNGNGAQIAVGSINHEVKEYDASGNLVNNNDETMALIYETNMSSSTRGSRFIEVKNTGTLNMEYSLTFSVEGNNIGETGIMYYRLYEVTDQVLASNPVGAYDTKLKAYAHNNPIPNDIESNTSNPVYNLTTMNNKIVIGEIEKSNNDEQNSVYYRLDYGIYRGIDSSIYSNASMSLHMNVYSSQVGTIKNELALGKIWEVSNEEQFRAALQGAYPGDTIKLLDDIYIDGTIEFNKRISLDTNEQLFKVSGDLVYEFVNMGKLNIDVTGSGRLEVGNNLYINTPKAEVSIIGANKASDIVVGGKVTVNGIQDGEKDGVLLDNVRMVKSIISYIPVDITVLSNTRLTLSPNVEVGFIYANTGSTNIEIVNNGTISQIQLQNMSLLDTFTKPQIYIYNLGEIYGSLGTSSIILPPTAKPYKGANDGNTLIIKGVTSSDISVSGSEYFNNGEINDITEGTSVIPYENEDNAYYIYIREPIDTVEGLLSEYFQQKNQNVALKTANIRKLTIYTLNAQYIENDDFDFLKSDRIPYLEELDISSARIIDNFTVNRIKQGALQNKTSLKHIDLPKTLTEIGSYAFSGVNLGNLSIDPTVKFTFLSIPNTVEIIEQGAFDSTKYVRFEGQTPPRNINETAFNTSEDGAKFFVPDGTQDIYQLSPTLNSSNIFRHAQVSDNRRYFVYEVGENLGISYIINNSLATTSLGIPNQLTYLGANKTVVEIGTNAYRHINITSPVTASLPNTITKIGSYAFYNLNITTIDLNNVQYIGKYAFYQTKLERIVAPAVKEIEDYAFYNNSASILSLRNIEKIGEYAFANSQNMYEANLGNVSYLGNFAFFDCKHLSRVYFTNTDARNINNKEEINLYVGTESVFSNWGYYIDGRLRVYVPSGNSSNGNSFVNLYKDKFAGNDQYVYETGTIIGSYHHMEVPYDLSEYTVKQKTITTPSGNVAVGIEIISYQGKDMDNQYTLPTQLTVNGRTMDVISIGDNAYRNVHSTSDADITIYNENIVNIGNNAFQDINIRSITATNVETIGNYAFSGSKLNKGLFRSLIKLGDYALANLDDLYVLDLGPIQEFGYNCIANDRYLQQLFLANEVMNIELNGTPFSNLGTYTNDRLRIYVPDNDIVLDYYKEIIPEYKTYIYPTGRIEGSYINSETNYDIGEYSLREKTITKKDGRVVTGYELIEYHGADLTPAYNIPEEIDPVSKDIKVTWQKNVASCWDNGLTCQWTATITNVSDNPVTSWELTIPLQEGTQIVGGWGGNYTLHDGYITVRNQDYAGYIGVNQSNSELNLQIKYPNVYMEPEVTKTRINLGGPDTVGLSVISVGAYAYAHVHSMPGFSVNIDNNSILYIGKNAFSGNNGIETISSNSVETIDEGAFQNSEINRATFPNLNTLETKAFSNTRSLYYLNLGTVKNIKEKGLSDLPYLYQVYFTGTNLDLNFDSNALSNIGNLTNNRMRLYVSNGSVTSDKTYAENYGSLMNNYESYFFETGDISGNYTPDDITYDIGQMTIKQVTLRNKQNIQTTGWEIVEYHGPTINNNVTIPNSIQYYWMNYPVISIGRNAFRNSQITENTTINIPNGVINIDDYAFYNTPIKSVRGSNVETIGEYAFSNCQNLTDITFDNVVTIESYAFYDNHNLKNVTLSSSTRTIGDYAFYNTANFNSLTNFYISTGTPPSIEEHTLPEIGNNNITTIYVPYSSINIFSNANYWKNYNIMNIGNIYNQTFVYENIGNNEIRITGYLQETENLTIPESLNINYGNYRITEIDGSMFNTINTIKTLTLSRYIKSIGDDFLIKNSSIENIIVDNNNQYYKSVNGVLFNKAGTTLIKYPNGKLDTEYTLPSGVILIKANAFTNSFNLNKITFNSDLFIISNNSFNDCINLTTFEFTGSTAPYITAFNVLPIHNTTKIYVPNANISEYTNNIFYYKYRNYIQGR